MSLSKTVQASRRLAMTLGLAALALGVMSIAAPHPVLGDTCLTCGGGGDGGGGPTTYYKLSVTVTGPGTVSDGSQSCTQASCTFSYVEGTTANLTATPNSGYSLIAWGGYCSGTGACSIPMDYNQSVSATFADVTPPPPPTITSPSEGATSTSGSQAVSFSGSSDTVSFLCKVDNGASTGCSSGWSTGALSTGQHTVYVYAKDAGDNLSNAASRGFRVVNLPDTAIGGTPAEGALVNTASTAFVYLSDTGTSFSCVLDGASVPCSANLSAGEGEHTLSVAAGLTPFSDNITYWDPTPAVRQWTVDTKPPDTSIVSGPPAITSATTAALAFTGADPAPGTAIHFECRLDGGAYQPCTSPVAYSGLALGMHTASVRAVDAAGNTDPTPASLSWKVEAVPGGMAPGKLASVRWRAHGSRTELRTLTLTGLAAGSKVAVTCKGSGCPFKSRSAKVSGGQAKLGSAFAHHSLRQGTRIGLQITAPGWTPRIITLRIRAHHRPLIAGG